MAKTGRKAGGSNFKPLAEQAVQEPTFLKADPSEPQTNDTILPEIFTTINKDFIRIDDLMAASGLAYDTCSRIIREIKAISDTFQIAGTVHRADYYAYIKFRLNRQEVAI